MLVVPEPDRTLVQEKLCPAPRPELPPELSRNQARITFQAACPLAKSAVSTIFCLHPCSLFWN